MIPGPAEIEPAHRVSLDESSDSEERPGSVATELSDKVTDTEMCPPLTRLALALARVDNNEEPIFHPLTTSWPECDTTPSLQRMKTFSIHFMEPSNEDEREEWSDMKSNLRRIAAGFSLAQRTRGIIRWDETQADMGKSKWPP